jgi:hypothetical protein
VATRAKAVGVASRRLDVCVESSAGATERSHATPPRPGARCCQRKAAHAPTIVTRKLGTAPVLGPSRAQTKTLKRALGHLQIRAHLPIHTGAFLTSHTRTGALAAE